MRHLAVSLFGYGGVSDRAECCGGLSTAGEVSRWVVKGGEGQPTAKMPKQFHDGQGRSTLQEEYWIEVKRMGMTGASRSEEEKTRILESCHSGVAGTLLMFPLPIIITCLCLL